MGSLGTSERSTMKQTGGASGKESASNAGYERDLGSIPGLGRSPGEGHGNPLQCSCLENPLDREAWQDRVYGVKKSQTRLSNFASTHVYAGKHSESWLEWVATTTPSAGGS